MVAVQLPPERRKIGETLSIGSGITDADRHSAEYPKGR
jgi:hypothetical protein